MDFRRIVAGDAAAKGQNLRFRSLTVQRAIKLYKNCRNRQQFFNFYIVTRLSRSGTTVCECQLVHSYFRREQAPAIERGMAGAGLTHSSDTPSRGFLLPQPWRFCFHQRQRPTSSTKVSIYGLHKYQPLHVTTQFYHALPCNNFRPDHVFTFQFLGSTPQR